MAREITTTGSKKVSTLCKEFNANFPYLRLKICPPEAKALVAKGETINGVDNSKTLSEIRTKRGAGEISFTGSKNVGRIEWEFETIFGLYVQICYTTKEGKRYYTSGADDKKSLTQLNREKTAEGCKKDVWE
ncbi:MAG TPA: hypothetical protein DCR46_05265 [Cytophagales bacterium]|nr:hypothetical protein [Cytophagales bacterium]